MYCFLGLAIVSDIFMVSIEAITSQRKRVFDRRKNRYKTKKVWNDSVANLTLMALGSSAPEILLNVIEIFKDDFYSGALGPGTIVGSAAFNLLVISAVCVVSIPSPDVRYIKEVPVYVVTAVFSILAYMWLIVILSLVSRDCVTLFEALLTFAMFPILVGFAFCADQGYLGAKFTGTRKRASSNDAETREVVKLLKEQFVDLDDDHLYTLVQQKMDTRVSRSQYARVSKVFMRTTSGFPNMGAEIVAEVLGTTNEVVVGFAMAHHVVYENAGAVSLPVLRTSRMDLPVSVKYRTKAGTAVPVRDYVHADKMIQFEPGVSRIEVPIDIIDDNTLEEDRREFYVELYDPVCQDAKGDKFDNAVKLSLNQTVTITVIDDDHPGVICFEREIVTFEEGKRDEECKIKLLRRSGKRGTVSCRYRTESASAISPVDFEAVDEDISFDNDQTEGQIAILIKARNRYVQGQRFRIQLYEEVGRSEVQKRQDGDIDVCWVEIRGSKKYKDTLDRVVKTTQNLCVRTRYVMIALKEQLIASFFIGGSAEEQSRAGCLDWFVHLFALPWKIIFACVPPAEFANGWMTFFCALVGIGVVTAFVSDLAPLLGCSLNIPDEITAITIVALGTSLPDTFASKTAAVQDLYADASIGNVTGSNSVNVFLGLGLPWTLAALYWKIEGATDEWKESYPKFISRYPSGGFIVQAGNLGFSVNVFTACALACIAALAVRRRLFGGELGGPMFPKMVTAVYLLLMWFGYVAATWLQISV